MRRRIDGITTLETELDRLLDFAHLLIECTAYALAEKSLKKRRRFRHRLGLGLSFLVCRYSFALGMGTLPRSSR